MPAKKEPAAAKKKQPAGSKQETRSDKDFILVGLGASAGGVHALMEFFGAMPPNSGMAFVVVLHLSPDHESNLAEVIQTRTTMPVHRVIETEKVEPNCVYVIPPNRQLEMVDGVVRLVPPQKEKGTRVAIDVFFRTLAETYRENAVCIVLSGTGQDGTSGLKRVKECNGFAIVQDPNEAEYKEMPQSAIETAIADWVLPVSAMPDALLTYKSDSERIGLTNGDDADVSREIKADDSLREILTLLRIRTGHDFTNYKMPTLIRRLARHLQIYNLPDLPSYLAFLKENPNEIQSLLRSLLINVTNFFRDKEPFRALGSQVIPRLFENKTSVDTIRVWSAGCASGEEPYSIAILLAEYAEKLSDPPRFQIFATDADEGAIAEAREHSYPETIQTDVSPELLRKYFTKEGERYRIRKELRETVLFAPHNVLRDPPFSRLDLITCRNVLIYLNRETQERVLQIFHFALNPHGYLFLGNSESADAAPTIFLPVDKKNRLFERRSMPAPFAAPPQMPQAGRWQVNIDTIGHRSVPRSPSMADIHNKLIEAYAPPSVFVDKQFDIVYISPSGGRFLRFSGGGPSNNILKLVHPDLLPDLRAALYTAQREGKTAEFNNPHVTVDDELISVNIVVRPVPAPGSDEVLLLVVFDDGKQQGEAAKADAAERTAGHDGAMETVVQRLEEELRRTREHLRATIEQNETTVEEFKAANEELQAINEELRSATEELETSKEELQSVNEELTTVNHELKEKMDEASRIHADLHNFVSSADIAIIFLDRGLSIRRFTPPAQKIFNVEDPDIGRPLEHFTNRLNYKELTHEAEEVLSTLKTIEREVRDVDGTYYIARLKPYLTVDSRIDGVVITFVDITARKLTEGKLRESDERFRLILESATEYAIFTVDLKRRITSWSAGAENLMGFAESEMLGRSGDLIFTPEDRKQGVPVKETGIAAAEGRAVNERWHLKKDGSRFWGSGLTMPLRSAAGEVVGFVKIMRDLTVEREAQKREHERELFELEAAAERERAQARITETEARLSTVMENVEDYAIFTVDPAGQITSWNNGARRIFQWADSEVTGRPVDIIFTPEDREHGVPQIEMQTAIEKGRAPDERFHIRKDGSRFFVSGVMSLLKGADGAVNGFVKIARDMTEQQSREKALRDREMLQRLVTAQEDERARFARDLHDELGQQLTVLRMKLDSIRSTLLDEQTKARFEELGDIARNVDEGIDFLAWEMRPAALDHLGLVVALDRFVKQWSYHSGIEGELIGSTLRSVRFEPEIEINLYRIAQEALNNIQKHSKATKVEVMIERRDDSLVMVIEDNGRGFNQNNKRIKVKGIGLTGMKERAQLIGGRLEIESAPRKGTTVFAAVPALPVRRSK